MHALHPDRRVLLGGLLALLIALVALATAPALPELSLGGGGGEAAAPPVERTEPVPPSTWATDPLGPPALLR